MAAQLVGSATSDKLVDVDWTKNIEICEMVVSDHKHARDVIKAIKKCVGSKNANTQLYAVMLLEMLMNNVGEPVHKQVIEAGILPILVKIVKKKSDFPVREKIFLLLDAAQTSLGGASGRFPQYYTAFYELVSAGVQFPDRRVENITKPNSTSILIKRNPSDKESAAPPSERSTSHARDQSVSGLSILQKAGTVLEVLRDVLDSFDTQRPEEARNEFTLDLVEQCSFEKQRVMHLAMISRDEKMVARALELNDRLEKVLHRHDALVAGGTESNPNPNHIVHEQREVEGEEEDEQLFRRIRKGKASLRPEDDNSLGLMGRGIPSEILHRSLLRPLTLEPQKEGVRPSKLEGSTGKLAAIIPPPPHKHMEREKFFQENKTDDVSSTDGRVSSLELHSRNGSSSRSGSFDFTSHP